MALRGRIRSGASTVVGLTAVALERRERGGKGGRERENVCVRERGRGRGRQREEREKERERERERERDLEDFCVALPHKDIAHRCHIATYVCT